MQALKLIITSRQNLQTKYGSKFGRIEAKLDALIKSDAKRGLETRVVYIDDAASARAAKIKAAKGVTAKGCKDAVDALYVKHVPAYIALLGAQDVFPFQELVNPAKDDDIVVPSDLPYACDAPFSRSVSGFTGPTRVVGRIPDVPGWNDVRYLLHLLQNSSSYKQKKSPVYEKEPLAVTAQVWQKSTEQSLQAMFGQAGSMLASPPQGLKYGAKQLGALMHFYNCHGAPADHRFYGQRRNSYPEAQQASNLLKKVKRGTVVAAECCYGSELVDPALLEIPSVNGAPVLSIANTYLGNNALAFVGSSTIAYGPPDGQGLADLVTQYFIKNILCGASAGRAMLEARQRFLTVCGPHLDPYELKTAAQFYLLGDPSVQPVLAAEEDLKSGQPAQNGIENNRINLFHRGKNLQRTLLPAKEQPRAKPTTNSAAVNQLLKSNRFKPGAREQVFEVKPVLQGATGMEKRIMGEKARFRTFIETAKTAAQPASAYRVLVVKENDEQVLGWRIYVSR